MKNLKKVLALVLAVVMIMGVVATASAKTYTDVKATDNYADAIDALSSLNILDGFKDGDNYSFKADGTFTRAQAAKIVAIVHNAATNGAIKGQDAISALYSNAQNPFVDCNSNWALPFINYCRITGLADGMTATTYAPNRELTGVQWLKLMLTTLNFDTAKEGYTGTGWDVNVLNRANEIGLTAGLAKDWRAIAPIKRGEAAQVLYNALTKYLVEYGQLVKNNYDTTGKYYKTAFISNEQVAQSGYTLGGKMGITIKRATDKFRRPGYTWSYGAWSAFYMDAPIAEYKEAVSACTILKNDMGISESSGKSVALYTKDAKGNVIWNKTISYIKNGKIATDDNFSILNYFAVDGRKFDGNALADFNAITLSHDDDKNCQKTSGKWDRNHFGGQGDLTQVFETEDGYVITVIHTFLAKVDSVTKTNRRTDHTDGEYSTLNVWMELAEETPDYSYVGWREYLTKTVSTTKYDAGSMVLVNLSLKKDELTNYATYGNDAKASIVGVADSKTGALTGASDINYGLSVSIDGTKYPGNCRFVLGREAAMNIAHWKTGYTFYFDTYGNVIGCTDKAASTEYVVMDKIWGVKEDGDFVIKANLYDLSGNPIEKVTVSAKAGSFKGATEGDALKWFYGNKFINETADKNDPNLTNALYNYTVDDKGVYTLTWVGAEVFTGCEGYSRFDAGENETSYTTQNTKYFQHRANRASIDGTADWTNTDSNVLVNLTESTKFVCKGVDGTWKTFTGYTALPALTAQYVDYIKESADSTFASIVYLGNVAYAGDKVTGYVTKWSAFNWSQGYDIITVWVDGEAMQLNLPHKYQNLDEGLKAGIYEFTTAVDADGVTYVTYRAAINTVEMYEGVVAEGGDASAIVVEKKDGTGKTPAIGLTNVKIYLVSGDKVTAVEASEIQVGDQVVVYADHATDNIVAIYIVG